MKYSSLSRNANKAYTIGRNRVLLFSTSALKKILRNWKRERTIAKEQLTTRTHWQKYVCAVLPKLSHVMRFRVCYWLLWEKIGQKESTARMRRRFSALSVVPSFSCADFSSFRVRRQRRKQSRTNGKKMLFSRLDYVYLYHFIFYEGLSTDRGGRRIILNFFL